MTSAPYLFSTAFEPPEHHRSPATGAPNMKDGRTHPVIWAYEPDKERYRCYLGQLAFELRWPPPTPSQP